MQPPLGEPQSPYAQVGRGLLKACREHGVGIELRSEPTKGPRFLRFNVKLSQGARVAALRRLMPEVAHRLGLSEEPMVTQEAGALFIDVARTDPERPVRSNPKQAFRDGIPSWARPSSLWGSTRRGICTWRTSRAPGRPHALVAGGTGSGKSEWLRTAVAGLLASNTPDTLRLVTIDPKINAFGDLEKSSFLWTRESWWIPGSNRHATDVFDELITEMDRRYRLTRASGADNLADHVRKTGRPLPRIVCVCDEYMALVASNRDVKKQIEEAVTLLGAKARASGIHLVLATQQPSRAVVSGAIQANLPCRVALKLTSHIESTMILGHAGAERLTGNGNLLYRDFGNAVRLQAPLLSEADRRRRFSA